MDSIKNSFILALIKLPMNNSRVFFLGVLYVIQITLIGCQNDSGNAEHSATASGNLDCTFFNQFADSNLSMDSLHLIEELNKDGWKYEQIQNGIFNPCYNFKPLYGSIDNYLNIIVGGGTDVVIKLMDLKTDICARYVYIKSNSTFSIRNIPEGQYYLKIAYGKQWFSKISEGICIGKFTSNALYEKADETLDFKLIQETDGYSIPSYEVSLDVVSSGIQNSLTSDEISEEEFNK